MQRWLQHPLITGDLAACPPAHPAGALGANGILITREGDVLVDNTTKGTVVRIPVNADGSAGEPRVVAGPDCGRLKGADGMRMDAAGNLYIAANAINRIVKVAPDGEITTLESGGILDFPSALALGADGRWLYVVNFAAPSLGSSWPARPGILRKDLGR